MDTLVIESINPHNLGRYEDWLHEQSANMLFGSSQSFVGEKRETLAWQVQRDDENVAIVTIDVDGNNIGHINLAVNPDVRRQGIGTKAIAQIVLEPGFKALRSVKATVAPSNTGGQKILIKSGFSRVGFDSEGLIEFEKR